jgi:hypothetical protein
MKKYLSTLVVGAAARPILIADIANEFTVAGKALPAGKYAITIEDENANLLGFQNEATGKKMVVEYMTRLAMRSTDQAELVFDKAGDSLYLSEIHLTDADGYFLPGAPAKHTHVRVKVGKKS